MSWTLPVLFVAGIFGGMYGASVGGGGLFTLPLLLLLGLPPQLALGTQRLSAVMLELASSIRLHKAKKLNVKLAFLLSLFAVVGSIAGTKIVIIIPANVLNVIISILLIMAAVVLFNRDRFKLQKHKLHYQNLPVLIPTGLVLGFYSGFLGAGFGAFAVIALSLFGLGFLESAAIARVVGFCTSLAGAIIFAMHGLINYSLALGLGAGFIVGSWVGIGMALKQSEDHIRVLLLLVITAALIKALWSL